MTPDDIIKHLDMQPHPEGGHFVETYRDMGGADMDRKTRGAVTCIYFLLKAGEKSVWHRVDATEIWHYVDGAPLTLKLSQDEKTVNEITLGKNVVTGEQPHAIVPPDCWQSAFSQGDWTLVSCIVAPAFEFDGFEMANKGWEPGE